MPPSRDIANVMRFTCASPTSQSLLCETVSKMLQNIYQEMLLNCQGQLYLYPKADFVCSEDSHTHTHTQTPPDTQQ